MEVTSVEWAVYRIFRSGDGHKMGSFVNMLASREEAETYAGKLEGEHEVVGLWTREITEEDANLWDTVVFDEVGGLAPVGKL